MSRKLIRNAARCLLCDDEVESKTVHDFRSCQCGNLSVDGGLDYQRRLFKNVATYEDLSRWADYEPDWSYYCRCPKRYKLRNGRSPDKCYRCGLYFADGDSPDD